MLHCIQSSFHIHHNSLVVLQAPIPVFPTLYKMLYRQFVGLLIVKRLPNPVIRVRVEVYIIFWEGSGRGVGVGEHENVSFFDSLVRRQSWVEFETGPGDLVGWFLHFTYSSKPAIEGGVHTDCVFEGLVDNFAWDFYHYHFVRLGKQLHHII
jgi:hypothetical protein